MTNEQIDDQAPERPAGRDQAGADGQVPADGALREALEREHRQIDGGIEDFIAARGGWDAGVARLRASVAALRRHIYLEEEFLFPPLREAGMLPPVLVMLAEHRELWRTMDALEESLGSGAAPEDLRSACRTLLAGLDRHNTKEEPIIYPQADPVLSDDQRAELWDFIAHEELPEGWVCSGL